MRALLTLLFGIALSVLQSQELGWSANGRDVQGTRYSPAAEITRAHIRTDPPYSTSTTTEQRIWEQAIWSGAIGATKVSSRTRMEQRFVSTGSETGWRLWEFVKVVRPVASQTNWSAVVSDEYFLNLNSTDYGATAGPDRNRFFVGPSVSPGKAVFVEIGYLNQYTFRSNGPDKNDHLIATNLFWSF